MLPGNSKHTPAALGSAASAAPKRFWTSPLFANLRHNKRLKRFTLPGQAEVDAQWKLFALSHNIDKLAHHGPAQRLSRKRHV